jgi:hypothetical protein
VSDLRRFAEQATPGPWEAAGLNEADDTVITADDDPVCHAHPDDTRFIAACDPQTVLAILDERDRLRAALVEILDEFDASDEAHDPVPRIARRALDAGGETEA